ncbi:MAG: phage portal protein [Brucella intermedia]
MGLVSLVKKTLSPVFNRSRGWFSIMESFPGAWQRNVEVKFDSVLSYHADFACRTLIASDIAKLRIKLMKQDGDGIWAETKRKQFSDVLNKPNHYQNRIQFIEHWVLSKLQTGNTYVLKQRNERGHVVRLYVLDPKLVTPLVSPDGAVFYQIDTDNLAGIEQSLVVPEREIIHDRFNCFYHPLVGISPIFAGGLSAMQGLAIQNDSTSFFQNGAQPGGILTAPGEIDEETAKRIKEHWENEYSGKNTGKVAVLGDGLKYEPMKTKAVDAQLIEQLKWSATVVCSVYHVPPYKAGIGEMPANTNIQSLNLEYYSQCLQIHIESIELCLDEGLGTGEGLGTELDVDNLLRMDTATQMEVLDKSKGILSPNEQRKRLNLPPKPGGNSPMLQQQNYSLEALAKRDAKDDPFGKSSNDTPPAPSEPPPEPEQKHISTVAVKALFAGQRNTRKAA